MAQGDALHPFDLSVLDAVEVGIVTTDDRGVITFANAPAVDLLRGGEPLVGERVSTWLGLPDDVAEAVGSEPTRQLAYAHETPDGLLLDLEMTVGRSNKPDGCGFFVVFRDVHEVKHREAARRRFEHLAAMGTMVAGFAHEVRNPVAALRSIAEELTEDLASQGVSLPHPSRMLRILERVERLVRTSLQFGRPAAPTRAPHRPWTICSEALAGIAPRTMAAGHPLRVEVEPDLPDAFVDHAQIVQVLINLLDNALDAASSPRGVLLRVSRARAREVEPRGRRSNAPPAPGGVRFEVIDDGIGIPVSEASRIFDPFFTTKSTGTGLGLSIAQQIVGDNGGQLELTSPRAPTIFGFVVRAAEDVE